MDRISALPDHILSRLSVKESARTSALSKRWYPLWLLSPIRISDRSLLESSPISFEDREVRADFLIRTYTYILTIHPGPIPTCHFTDPCWEGHPEILTRLLGTLTLKCVQELAIACFDCHNFVRLFFIPDCVLRCESLLDLELGAVVVPNHLSERIFPNLRRLKMWETDVSNHALSDLLKSSSSIVELELSGCWTGLHYTLIESKSLKSLSVGDNGFMRKLIIKDVPSLECLLMNDDFTKFCELEIINAPKLETLNCVDMKIAMLRLGNSQLACTTRVIAHQV